MAIQRLDAALILELPRRASPSREIASAVEKSRPTELQSLQNGFHFRDLALLGSNDAVGLEAEVPELRVLEL